MPRYAVISDIHSNLEALQAVLRECVTLKVQSLLCAGDIVGYGPNPIECVELIRQVKALTVVGNHDWAVSGRLDFSYFTDDGRAAVKWTQARISLEHLTYLNSLELSVQHPDFTLVHAALKDPQNFMYVTDIAKAKPSFEVLTTPVCFIGHTHLPGIFAQGEGREYYVSNTSVEMDPKYKYIVNAGSVGQPRDGNPMASFCIYDTQLQTIELKRVPYDFKVTQAKIAKAGLPRTLGLRLAVGK